MREGRFVEVFGRYTELRDSAAGEVRTSKSAWRAAGQAAASPMPQPRGAKTAVKEVTHSSDDAAVNQQGDSALVAAKRNARYLINPAGSSHPTRFRTRALLRTLRYATIFIFWRLVRWAKYVAVGSLVAAIGATAFGGVVTGAAWIAAPPTIGASIIAASVWGVGKFGARRLHKRWKKSGGDIGEEERERASDESPVRREGTYGQVTGPQATPW